MSIKKYDLIIAGGGTAGCAAAYTAGKAGLSVLLIEKNSFLGGSITSARVIPAMYSGKSDINNTFFEKLALELNKIGGQVTYDSNIGWFNPELCKIVLDKLMNDANVDILFNSAVSDVKISKNHINGVKIPSKTLSVYIEASSIIDATGNCEIGALANCNFLENNGEFQPVSLRFEMSGIDLKMFSKWILDFDKDRNVTTCYKINSDIHLSTAYTWDRAKKWALEPLFDDAVEKEILNNEDRSYFQLFTIPGMPTSVSFNCPRVYFANEIDPLDTKETSNALIKGRESILRLTEFCKIYLPGFKKAYISNIANELGVRVSRRIKGKYIYTKEDLLSGKKFANPVLKSTYPIDIHSNKKDKSILKHTNCEYELPVESLISADIDNLFVAGRCLSADFYAQGALRIQPSCFSMGEGIAKYIAEH